MKIKRNRTKLQLISFQSILLLLKKPELKKKHTDKNDSFQAPLYLPLFLNKIFQYIFRLLYDYGAEASQCLATSTV